MGMIRNAGKVMRLNMPNAIVKPRTPDEIQAVVWATQTHNQRIHTAFAYREAQTHLASGDPLNQNQ